MALSPHSCIEVSESTNNRGFPSKTPQHTWFPVNIPLQNGCQVRQILGGWLCTNDPQTWRGMSQPHGELIPPQ